MNKPLQITLCALGALALLVVVNWARKELIVGLIAALLLAVAALLVVRAERAAGEDER